MTDTFDFITRSGNATTTYRIRVVPLEGNPWFSLADCNRVLGRSQGGRKPVFIGSDERRTIREMNGVHLKGHGLLFVSESGLYKYIMRSDKPEARAFQEWVTREVLPTIRKTGGYVLEGADRATVGEGTVAEMPDVGGVLSAMREMEARLIAQFSEAQEQARQETRALLEKVLAAVATGGNAEEVKVKWTAAEINQLGIPPRGMENSEVGFALTAFCKERKLKVGSRASTFGRKVNTYSLASAKELWGR